LVRNCLFQPKLTITRVGEIAVIRAQIAHVDSGTYATIAFSVRLYVAVSTPTSKEMRANDASPPLEGRHDNPLACTGHKSSRRLACDLHCQRRGCGIRRPLKALQTPSKNELLRLRLTDSRLYRMELLKGVKRRSSHLLSLTIPSRRRHHAYCLDARLHAVTDATQPWPLKHPFVIDDNSLDLATRGNSTVGIAQCRRSLHSA
jgi:hypothetical protein